MRVTFKAGSIFIKEDIWLPQRLELEGEPCAPGWKLIKNLDQRELTRKIREAGWNFFSMADALKAAAFGRDAQKTADRAVRRMLARLSKENFNSLEVTRLNMKLILGVHYVTISAQSRHIQESAFLFRNNELSESDRARLAAACT